MLHIAFITIHDKSGQLSKIFYNPSNIYLFPRIKKECLMSIYVFIEKKFARKKENTWVVTKISPFRCISIGPYNVKRAFYDPSRERPSGNLTSGVQTCWGYVPGRVKIADRSIYVFITFHVLPIGIYNISAVLVLE